MNSENVLPHMHNPPEQRTNDKLQMCDLVEFNCAVIAQALDMLNVLEDQGKDSMQAHFIDYIGPHLRHILEHYEALFNHDAQQTAKTVDYDARQRDRALEQDASLMRARLSSLQKTMESWHDAEAYLTMPITVYSQGGVIGDKLFDTPSTIGREMLFLASHATHHFALIRVYCLKHGIQLYADFGKAPATIAHERTS